MFPKRLPESVVNDCNERIVRHSLNAIRSAAATDHDDDSSHGGGAAGPVDQQMFRVNQVDTLQPDCRRTVVRQQNILDHIVNLSQAHIRPIVHGKARCNVEFEAKISISVIGEGFTFLDRHSVDPYNEGEDLKAQARSYRRRHGIRLSGPQPYYAFS
jgi:hypothetical protein